MSGVIYQITCIPTGLCYVGQAKSFKTKKGVPYHYGASGRWNDHVASSKSRNTPICRAIKEYGRDQFTITILEEAPLDTLDGKESEWITRIDCIAPNGYNVASHGRNRHREVSNLHVFYEGKIRDAVIHPIHRNGVERLVYVYITLHNGTKERLAFGQKSISTFEDALEEARNFLELIDCPYTISTTYSSVISDRYSSKIEQLKNKTITSIRITSASNLVAVYIGTSEMKLKKEHVRICFGGKKSTKEEAYQLAKQFINELHVSDNIIIDSIKSSQQATAS